MCVFYHSLREGVMKPFGRHMGLIPIIEPELGIRVTEDPLHIFSGIFRGALIE